MGEPKGAIEHVGDPAEYICPRCGAQPMKLCRDEKGNATDTHPERITTAEEDRKARERLRFVGVRSTWKDGVIQYRPVVYHWVDASITRVYDLPSHRAGDVERRAQALMAGFVFCHQNGFTNVDME